jgi:myxalamid-type nonribosomal peptide synthetase MxaA
VAPTTMSAAAELDFSRIRAELRQIISDVIGANVDEIDDEAPLLDYVTSSLALLEGIRRVYERFGVLIPIRPLLEGAGNLRALSAFIDQALEGQEKSVQAVLPNGPEKVEAGPRIALAPSQQHIGFLARYSSGASSAYNETLAVRLQGPLHGPALQAAVEAVVERHEAARVALSRDHDAITFIAKRFELPISQCSDGVSSERVGEIAWRPFELGERLFRAELLRLGDGDHILVLVGHALVVDQDALSTILADIAQFYSGFAHGEQPQTSPATVQLSDYLTRHEQETATRARLAAQEYWTTMLAAAPLQFELPADRPRPAIKNYEGARLTVALPSNVQTELGAWPEFSASAVVFGAFTAFLHRLGAQREIVVGASSSPVHIDGDSRAACRTRHMLPVRSSYAARRTFADHVRASAANWAQADAHRQFALAEIIRVIKVGRDQSRSALFSAAFRSEMSDALPAFKQLRCSLVTVPGARARYDIELVLACASGEMELRCDYSTELFDGETIARWMDGFIEFVGAGLRQKERSCGVLPIIPDRLLRMLLHDWNATERSYPRQRTVLDLILDRVREGPEQTAVRCNGEELSYAQLYARAERIASMVERRIARPGARVAILLRRCTDLLAAILATWRLGAAYVPIDPDLPKKRIAFMLADSEAEVVITNRDLARMAEACSGARTLDIDDCHRHQVAPLPPLPASTGADSAYVIYTSGSTGQPKGVEILHHALLNCLLAVQERVGFSGSDSLLALTTPSFDISTVELLMPLIAGGIVELAEDGVLGSGIRLAERIEHCRPSFVQATPSTWKAILAAGWRGDSALRMGAGGEALNRDLAEQLLSKGGPLWNLYGPTETTVWSIIHQVQSAPADPIRIGRPIANTQIYILDDQTQPVPIGVVGELYIGGAGLARGYVGRPELTERSFVANPFRAGERLYRTGDLARYLANGDVVCLGRVDHQVKIHGYRVELQEIEAAVRAIAGIRDAVVTTWVDKDGDKQLVAHVVADAGETPAAAIRERLREELPEPMIPPYILHCDGFPLTPSGKIDRTALAIPAPGKGTGPADRTAVTTATERLVAQVWAKVLGMPVEQISRGHDFMDLGGHSLLMTPLMVEVRKLFNVTFSMRDFFAASTLMKFSSLIDKLQRSTSEASSKILALGMRGSEWGRERMAFLRREAELPSNIAPARGFTFQPHPPIRSVLLTGATGFLGAYLVNEILRTTDAHLHCLIRARDGLNSKVRMQEQLRHYELWQEGEHWQGVWEERVHVVAGDIILPRLGLPDPIYESLAREIDCIIHSAAHVNFIYPYEALKATNVLGLHEIVRFAFHGRIKPLHYLSTAAVWPMGAEYTFLESDALDHGRLLNLGYDEAKWVGERSLLNAAERGLPVARYRPGEVGGDSKTGRCVLNHFLIAAFKGFLQYGAFPAIETHVDVAPVDYIAGAIVYMIFHGNPLGRAFHLTNPRARHLREALAFLRQRGYRFEELGFEELRTRIVGSADFAQNALFPYQAVLESMDERSMQLPKYDCTQTLKELEGSDISCPAADEGLFEIYLRSLTDCGFLPAPGEFAARADRAPYAASLA